jgi:molybdate transport system substrate-binding protein
MTVGPVLQLLCAGAARGLVDALQARFTAATGARIEGRFGAVGAMKEALAGGAPCDVMVVTDAMVSALVESGALDGATRAPLGVVRTGVAVRAGDADPAIDTPDAVRAALLGADRICFPDPARATAGIHFASVLQRLGIDEALAPRLATFPNGATAMAALAASGERAAIGCTQITEILATPGVRLVGPLPLAFELATVYTAAVARQAADPALAVRFVDLLTGTDSREARRAAGFELEPLSGTARS